MIHKNQTTNNMPNKLQTAVQELEALAVLFKKDMKSAAATADPIMQKIAADLESPTGLVIESLIPNGESYAKDVIIAINAALPAIRLINGIGDVSSTKGLLQRLGATLTGIIHGGKLPFTYYVQEFEYVCFGTPIALQATSA